MFNITIKATNKKATHYKLYSGIDKDYSLIKNDYFPLIGWTTDETEEERSEEQSETEETEPETITTEQKINFLKECGRK